MKTKLTSYVAILLLAGALGANAAEPRPLEPGSAEFEMMKTLVGKWTGKVDMGQGPVEMNSQYRLIAGGTILEERVFAGTPQEMVTMYYDQNGKLAMTHYCILGNRPMMRLKSSTKDTLSFDFDPACGINPKKEDHMHALTLKFVDKNNLESSCRSFMSGQEAPPHAVTMKRVQ